MNQFIVTHAIMIRMIFFIGILLIMAGWEVTAPRRQLQQSKVKRWFSNLSIVVLNSILRRLLFASAAVGIALLADDKEWGFFHYYHVNFSVAFIASVIILDLAIYLQHVMFHAIPLFWRFHRMHHVDLDFDVTTGIRFHPIEIILSMLIKFTVIILIGAPVSAVIVFEVLLNATSMFNHGNVRLLLGLDKVIRTVIVTPDMHRVHHSINADETNSNFGFNFSCWDRLFGTYRNQPRAGHEGMTIGISTFREPEICNNLLQMLYLPFIGKVKDYVINRRFKSKR